MNWQKTKNGYFAVERAKDLVWLHCTSNPKNLTWQRQEFRMKDEESAVAFEKKLNDRIEKIKI